MGLNDYEIEKELGHGTFGVVLKATAKRNGRFVALKKFILQDKKEGFPITALREITILRKLSNINVIQVLEVVYDSNNFYTVCPYISSDLNGLLHNPRIALSIPQIKCIMAQILKGIDYIHRSGYLHRDIKTANILLDCFGIIKIADFGLARIYHGPPPTQSDSPPGGGLREYTGLVVTRWYRSPEILLGDRKYTTALDMWGIGCVFGELFKKSPILEGKSDLHQSELIFQLLGTPNQDNFPNCHLINRNNVNLKVNYERTLESKFSDSFMGAGGVDLLSGLLLLNPFKRFNALKALDHSWFKSEPYQCSVDLLKGLEESHESDVTTYMHDVASGNNTNNVNMLPAKINSSNINNGPWNKTINSYDYDPNAKRDRDDPYYFVSGGKRQRTDVFARKPNRNGSKIPKSRGLYGTSNSAAQLGLLKDMLHNNGKSNSNQHKG